LQRRIEGGRYRAGERLPGQHELAKQFGVSLTTMRTAISLLEKDGLLKSHHGLGTYVARPGGGPSEALVVDDDPESTALLTAILEKEGLGVQSASSRAGALTLAASQQFDIIFLDLVMPGGNGVETFADLRAMRVSAPVVIVTGVTDTDVIAKAADFGPLTLVRKPVAVSQIREVVRARVATSASKGNA
jgi:CheY-like chemotaxis protein